MIVGSPTKLNLIPSGVMPVVYINQGDAGYDKEFLIYNGDSPYNVPSGVSATIRGTKADGYGVTEAATVTTGSNLVTVTITEQMVAAAGENVYELVFVDTNDLRVASINMVWAVKKDALGDSVISDSDLDYVSEALDKIQNAEAMKNEIDANAAAISAEVTARQNAVAAEANARQAADNTLQSSINSEASTRATTDASLQSQINQLVAPSGGAPSAAEVQNARIGLDGTVYNTLGDAIRTQVADSETAIYDTVGFIRDNLIKNVTSYENLNGDTKNVLLTGCTATAGNDVIVITPTNTSVRFGAIGNASNNYNVTGYGYPIKCSGINKLRFILSNPACNTNYVSFWTSDGTFISSQGHDSTDFIADVPSNAYICAMRVDIRNATVGVEYPLTIKVFSYLENSMSEQIEQKTGEIDNGLGRFMSDYNAYFELGNIIAGSSGWSYADSNTRVRTLNGFGIRAYVGDIIALSDYSNARFYVGWRTLDGTFGSQGWNTSDFTVTTEGYYCILISNLTDTAQTDETALASLFRYYKKAHERIDHAASDIDKTAEISYETKSGYISASGTIGAAGEDGEVYTSYIPCNNGDVIKYYLSSSSPVKHWLSCALYDANKIFLNRIAVANYNITQNIINGEFTVSNASVAFIRLTYRSFTDVDAHFSSTSFLTLSAAQTNERLESFEDAIRIDVVPSYFENNLSVKIPEVIENMNEAGQSGTTFIFITDLHWETNYKNSPSLVKRVLDKTSVKNVFCGGDIINEGEKADMAATFLDCINQFRFVPNNGFFPIARGNHDDNSNWTTEADIAAHAFDDSTVYNLLYSQIAENVTRIGENWSFYFDHHAIKTRYIFVDTKRNGLTIDATSIIDCLNSVETDWNVIIIMHYTLNNATTLFEGCSLLGHIVKAYNDRESGSYAGAYQTVAYDFTNAAGYVDVIIGGHRHADYAMAANDANNPSGIPIIATDSDSYRSQTGIEGTVNSQCFDVVTVNYTAKTVKCVRIGRGNDRNFSY